MSSDIIITGNQIAERATERVDSPPTSPSALYQGPFPIVSVTPFATAFYRHALARDAFNSVGNPYFLSRVQTTTRTATYAPPVPGFQAAYYPNGTYNPDDWEPVPQVTSISLTIDGPFSFLDYGYLSPVDPDSTDAQGYTGLHHVGGGTVARSSPPGTIEYRHYSRYQNNVNGQVTPTPAPTLPPQNGLTTLTPSPSWTYANGQYTLTLHLSAHSAVGFNGTPSSTLQCGGWSMTPTSTTVVSSSDHRHVYTFAPGVVPPGTLTASVTAGIATASAEMYVAPVATFTATPQDNAVVLDAMGSFALALATSSPSLLWRWQVPSDDAGASYKSEVIAGQQYTWGVGDLAERIMDGSLPASTARWTKGTDSVTFHFELQLERVDYPAFLDDSIANAQYPTTTSPRSRTYGSAQASAVVAVSTGRLVSLAVDPSGFLIRAAVLTSGSDKILTTTRHNGLAWATVATDATLTAPALSQPQGISRLYRVAQRQTQKDWQIHASSDLGSTWGDAIATPFDSTHKAATRIAWAAGGWGMVAAVASGGAVVVKWTQNEGKTWQTASQSPGSGSKSLDLEYDSSGRGRYILVADNFTKWTNDLTGGIAWVNL